MKDWAGFVAFTLAACGLLAGASLAAGTAWTIPYVLFVLFCALVFDHMMSRPPRRPTR